VCRSSRAASISATDVGGRNSQPRELLRYYSLQATLARLVDFGLINSKSIRLSDAATNARTGTPVYFDNWQHPITSAHIMASASLPPSFPPTEIDGEYYWDGAVVSNSPMQYVIDDASRYTALVFQVDLWDANGEIPLDVPSAYSGCWKSTAPRG
jgi:NTE family protein